MDMSMDYHVWGAMLEHYQIHMPKVTNIMLSWMTVLSIIRNDLLQELINKAIVSFFATDFDCGLLQLVGNDIVNTLFKYWVSHRHLTFIIKTFELLIKSSAKFDSLVVNIQCANLKKWTLKFKLLYLLNHISYFNKICRICCLNTHIQSLKVWLKSVLQWLIYRIFFYGIVFYWCTLYISLARDVIYSCSAYATKKFPSKNSTSWRRRDDVMHWSRRRRAPTSVDVEAWTPHDVVTTSCKTSVYDVRTTSITDVSTTSRAGRLHDVVAGPVFYCWCTPPPSLCCIAYMHYCKL